MREVDATKRIIAIAMGMHVADTYRRETPDDAPFIRVCLAAVERGAAYTRQTLDEIMATNGAPVSDAEKEARLSSIVGGLFQTLGAALALAEDLPMNVLQAAGKSEWKAVTFSDKGKS